ncbi:DEAD/H helicase [Phlegmacium glaucopus]|nr:DEAD/H helicase [Phlegmacium glaucopus]
MNQPKRKKQRIDTNQKERAQLWPEYFHSFRRTYLAAPIQAVNTVLAFITSKRHLATSFPAVRSSVEGLLKHPLEIIKVAELKALLPHLLKFSYVPRAELQVHGDFKTTTGGRSVDYSIGASSDQQGQVLVLEFTDGKARGTSRPPNAHGAPPSLSPAAVKKLVESRNARFEQAVNELLIATPPEEDPVTLLVAAATNFVPANQEIPCLYKDLQTLPQPSERPTIDQVISEIERSNWYIDQIVDRRTIEAKEAQTGSLHPPMSQMISNAVLHSRNIHSLYSHQVSAIESIRKGKHVVVSTSTASGKSAIYQVPLLTFLEENPEATTMLVFPTKALAQDQKASLEQLFQMCPKLEHLKVATYDGDTPRELRAEIRETASVILTNFDTIHASILPCEESWRGFLKRMKILAVDELHYYTGLLGSHVAYILRRFRRVCAAIGNQRIRFISCSATLANPAQHMSKIFCLDVSELDIVSNDGAPSGKKEYIIWNPPPIDPEDPALGRRSSISEASQLMRFLMKKGIRVILFCKIRKVCELVMKTVKADLSDEGRQDILERVRSYRGGYTPEDRRKIEHEAFSGQLLGIIATNALELGIDIGVLDAVLMLGFPNSISNFKQQAGRAGRRSGDSLAIMVADPFPIDQYYVAHPAELFESSLDDLVVNVDNDVVLEVHLQCAAYEVPLTSGDQKWFGVSMVDICEKNLTKDHDGWRVYHTHPKFLPFPATHVSIRGARQELYMVLEMSGPQLQSANMLEEVEFYRVLFELYEGGVFMHQGMTFIVKEVNHDAKIARVIRADVNYITSPRHIEPLQTYRIQEFKQVIVNFGSTFSTTRLELPTILSHKTILDAVDLLTPPCERETTGFWIDLPTSILDALRLSGIDSAEATHAAEHAFLNQFPLSEDLKTDCRVVQEDNKDSQVKRYPRLVFYDFVGKTGGVAARAFEHVQAILAKALTTIEKCKCSDGCTLCVQSTACKDANLVSSKLGAGIILRCLLGLDSINLRIENCRQEAGNMVIDAISS